MATRFIDHLLEGDHASRPAFGDVPQGTLYACSDHDLIYQSDGVAAWSTWATLGTSGGIPASLVTAKGDLIVATGSGAVDNLAVGANDTIPMADSAQTTGLKWVASATPSTQAFGDAAAAGTGDTFTRGDHKHAMPAAAITSSGLTQATARILGRTTASTGAIEEITVGSGLSLAGGSISATGGGGGVVPLSAIEAQHRFLLDAHRGDINPVDGFPENTLEAARLAAFRGADRIEIDCQLSGDDTWYLMHDSDVARTTDGSGDISGKTDVQVDALNIDGGFGWDSGRHGTTLNVPTLESVLDALRPYDVVVDFDLKDTADADHTDLATFIVAQGWESRAIINAKSLTGAAAVKAVSSVIQVMTQTAVTDNPESEADVDIWLAARTEVTAQSDVTSRAPEQVAVFFDTGTDYGDPEASWIEAAYDFGVRAVMTNDLPEALRIRHEYEFGAPSAGSTFPLTITWRTAGTVSGFSATTTLGNAATRAPNDMTIVNFRCQTFVPTTNDGSNFWTVHLSKVTAANAKTVICSIVTSSDATSTWTTHEDSTDEFVAGATYLAFEIVATKTGSPGNLFSALEILYTA